MAEAQRSDFLIVAATIAALGGGLWLAIAPRPVTKPAVVKSAPPPVEKTIEQPKQAADPKPLPKLHKPAPIMKPERKSKKRAARERTKRTASLPSCSRIRAEYNRMSLAEKLAAYQRATPEQVAHGRRCLGL